MHIIISITTCESPAGRKALIYRGRSCHQDNCCPCWWWDWTRSHGWDSEGPTTLKGWKHKSCEEDSATWKIQVSIYIVLSYRRYFIYVLTSFSVVFSFICDFCFVFLSLLASTHPKKQTMSQTTVFHVIIPNNTELKARSAPQPHTDPHLQFKWWNIESNQKVRKIHLLPGFWGLTKSWRALRSHLHLQRLQGDSGDTADTAPCTLGMDRCRFVVFSDGWISGPSELVFDDRVCYKPREEFGKKSSLTSWILVELTMWFCLKIAPLSMIGTTCPPKNAHHMKAIGNSAPLVEHGMTTRIADNSTISSLLSRWVVPLGLLQRLLVRRPRIFLQLLWQVVKPQRGATKKISNVGVGVPGG